MPEGKASPPPWWLAWVHSGGAASVNASHEHGVSGATAGEGCGQGRRDRFPGLRVILIAVPTWVKNGVPGA